jgi:hypothetical protein
MLLEQRKTGIRFLVFVFKSNIDIRDFLLAIYDEGMFGLGWALVGPSMDVSAYRALPGGLFDGDGRDLQALQVLQGAMKIDYEVYAMRPSYRDLEQRAMEYLQHVDLPGVDGFDPASSFELYTRGELNTAVKLYDAIQLYAHAIDDALRSNPGLSMEGISKLLADGSAMFKYITRQKFTGLTGYFFSDKYGVRDEEWMLYSIWGTESIPGARISGSQGFALIDPPYRGRVTDWSGQVTWTYQGDPFLYPGNTTQVPLDVVTGECFGGSYFDEAAKECRLCEAGLFTSSSTSQTHTLRSCEHCPAGYSQLYSGQKQCTPCDAGYSQPGYSTSGQRSLTCLPCKTGTYAASSATGECTSCPLHSSNVIPEYLEAYILNANMTLADYRLDDPSACICQVGYYGKPGGVCTKCPDGGSCCQCAEGYDFSDQSLKRNGGNPCRTCVSGAQQHPLPLPGYVLSKPTNVHGAVREAGGASIVVQCHQRDACLGGPDSTCQEGYSLRRCGTCSEDWYSVGGVCHQCSTVKKVVLPILLVLVGLIAFGGFVLITALDPRRGSVFIFILRFAETIALLKETAIEFPDFVADALNIIAVVNINLEVFAVQCITGAPTNRGSIFSALIAPVIFLLLPTFFSIFIILTMRLHRSDPEKEAAREQHARLLSKLGATDTPYPRNPFTVLRVLTPKQVALLCFAAYFKLLVSAYPFFATTFISSIVGCRTLADGTTALVKFPSEYCDGDENGRVSLAVIGLIVYGLGIPLLCFVAAFGHHFKKMKDDFSYFLVHATYSGHRSHIAGFAWRATALWRVLLIILIAFADLSPEYQLVSIGLILSITIFAESLAKPRPSQFMCVMESLEELVVLTIMLIGYLSMHERATNPDADMAPFVAIICITVLFYMGVILCTLVLMTRKVAKRLGKSITSALVKVSTNSLSPNRISPRDGTEPQVIDVKPAYSAPQLP